MESTELLVPIIHGRVDPYIYAFETNTVPNFLKVGDTYRPVEVRLDEWRKIYANLNKKYEHIAKVDGKTYFRDYSVHDFLMSNGFRRIEKSDISKLRENLYISNEFFLDAKAENVEQAISDIQHSFDNKENRYMFYNAEDKLPLGEIEFLRDADWKPRDNQKEVINNFVEAVNNGRTNLLMFAVMRFGKSFTSLCCAKAMGAKLVVVVCGKTAVRSEWKENVQRPKILDGFYFADSFSMQRNPNVVSEKLKEGMTVVVFLSLQDLIGEGIKNRHQDLFDLNSKGKLDLLIIDETHFGARAREYGKVLGSKEETKLSKQEKANGYDDSVDELENEIKVFAPKVKLHLSGTPYRILLENEFANEDIVGLVQYSDIIDEKEKWDRENIDKDEWENPYYGFPQMIRFAFNPNKSSIEKLNTLKNNGYAYDLNELLAVESVEKSTPSQFKHKDEVLDLLRAIDGSKEDENIFSFLDYDKIKEGSMCRHLVMVLPFCASCDAMENLLKSEKFNNLNDYEIINISGNHADKIFNRSDYASLVKERIAKFESEGKKTISLTVGKMLTGSTVKEWDTMIFLRNTASPQDYDQAVFRLQSQYIKEMKSKDGKIIKYDMKPQTILVDFDPVRMYSLQYKKSLIAGINNSERGNELLEKKLERELEISPVIFANHNRLQKLEAKNIVDSIRNYNANKSMMDETFDIEVDSRIFDDDQIKSIIEKQPEITNKGVKFELQAYDEDEESETDLDVPNTDADSALQDESEKTSEKDEAQKKEDDENLSSKLQGYYFKLLLFAFLSEKEEKTVSDIINAIENDADGRRLGKHLQINVEDLKLVRERINPQILIYLENKIQNTNQLGNEITSEKISVALRKLSRLSASEVITPDTVAKEVVDLLPKDITAKSKILDIASKTGEFAVALLNKFGEEIKNNIYSIPTSPVTYECTRKIYRILGMPVENIFSTFTSYDLINKDKNENLLKELKDMNFSITVGNPPYQLEGNNNGRKQPIYNIFIDKASELTNATLCVTPARFLFGAGETPKSWNEKMLNDGHFSVAKYWADSNDVFPSVEIKGGIAVTLKDKQQQFEKIGIFTPYNELNSILHKVNHIEKDNSRMDAEVSSQGVFRFTEKALQENPKIAKINGSGTGDKIVSKTVDALPDIFTEEKLSDTDIQFFAKGKTSRIIRFIKSDYIQKNEYTDSFKVLIPESNGNGAFEVFSSPFVSVPNQGFSDTFIAVGTFGNRQKAENCLKYIKTKFARAMLGIKKVTQHNPKSTWTNVPLQDFTSNSDIDWSKSVSEIDKQLYKKYGLSEEEIAFIEKMVKPMG